MTRDIEDILAYRSDVGHNDRGTLRDDTGLIYGRRTTRGLAIVVGGCLHVQPIKMLFSGRWSSVNRSMKKIEMSGSRGVHVYRVAVEGESV